MPGLVLLFAALMAAASATQFTITITHTNDFHGYLQPATSSSVNNGGAPRMLYCEKYWRAQTDEALALDAGDLTLAGQPIGYLVNGSSVVDFFNLRGVRAAAVGNHDFDKGQANLIKRVAESNFTWLGANVIKSGTNWTHPDFLKPYVVVTMPISGVRIGIIGVTVPFCKYVTLASNTAGLEFLDGTDAIEHYYPEVKNVSDVIVVLAHIGKSTYTTHGVTYDGTPQIATKLNSRGVPVDLIVSGHDHQVMTYTNYNNQLVVDGDCNNRRLGIVVLKWDNETQTKNFTTKLLQINNASATDCPLGLDSNATALVNKWAGMLDSQLSLFLANSTTSLYKSGNWLGESNLGKLITDSFRYWGDLTDDGVLNNSTDVAFQNGGGIRTNLALSGSVRRIVWNDMATVLPMSNNMVLCTITGKQMREICETMMGYFNVPSSGIKLTWYKSFMANGTGFNTLESCTINGSPLNESATYRVSTTNYVAEGGGGMDWLVNATDVVYYNDLDMDAVTLYFTAKFSDALLTNKSYAGNRGSYWTWYGSSSEEQPVVSSSKQTSAESSVKASSTASAVPSPSAVASSPESSAKPISSAAQSADIASTSSAGTISTASAGTISTASAGTTSTASTETPSTSKTASSSAVEPVPQASSKGDIGAAGIIAPAILLSVLALVF